MFLGETLFLNSFDRYIFKKDKSHQPETFKAGISS